MHSEKSPAFPRRIPGRPRRLASLGLSRASRSTLEYVKSHYEYWATRRKGVALIDLHGARSREILELRWDHVDLQRGQVAALRQDICFTPG